jgi:hypothetical protein
MTENKSNKEYDFELQLKDGQEAEERFRKILLSKDTKFEVKAESNLWHDTGNLVIEYESYQKPSGIAATKSDYWVHVLRSRDKETLAYLMFPTPILKKICNDIMAEGVYARTGGENGAMRMLLLDIRKVLSRLQNSSGKGAEAFNGWSRKPINSELHVRNYRSSDYDKVQELYLQSDLYGGQFDEGRDSREKLAASIHADPQSILVCEEKGSIIGTISLIEQGRVAWFYRFAVAKIESEEFATKVLYDTACGILKARQHTQVLVYTPVDDVSLEKRYTSLGMNKGNTYTCFWQDLQYG